MGCKARRTRTMNEIQEINDFLNRKIKKSKELLKNKNSAFYLSEKYNLQMLKKIKNMLNDKKPSND